MSEHKKYLLSPATTPSWKRFKPSSQAPSEAYIPDAISQALAKQHRALELMISNAVSSAMEGVNISLRENRDTIQSLKTDIDSHITVVCGLITKVDGLQSETRTMKRDVVHCISETDKLHLKLADLEDRSRRHNVRIYELTPNREGDNPVGFLQKKLPKWIPSLAGDPILIERAHRIYGGNSKGSEVSRTMSFKVLQYKDRQAILQGAREMGPIHDNGKTLRFYADYSTATAQKRKAFVGIRNELEVGATSFLIYPATLRVSYNREQFSFSSATEAEN